MNGSKLMLLIAVAALCTAACAQIPGGPERGRGGVGAGRAGERGLSAREPPVGATSASPGAVIQVQLDRIEDALKLTSAQRPSWNAYADKVQKLADDISRSRFDARTARVPQTTAIEQLERLAETERERVAAISEIAALGRVLYPLLTPEQRALADQRLALPMMSLMTGVTPSPVSEFGDRSRRTRGSTQER